MQVEFFGANCFRLKINNTTLVFDDNLASLGGKSVASKKDVVCLTHPSLRPPPSRLIFDSPGSYEVNEILITAVAAEHFSDEPERKDGTIYKLTANNLSLAITGLNKAQLTEEQLDKIGGVDILCVAIGDLASADEAWQFVKALDPSLIIPSFYRQASLKFSHDWTTAESFVEKSRLKPEKVENPFRLKRADLGGEQIVLKIFP